MEISNIKKINFPYSLNFEHRSQEVSKRLVIFFGTDFYNLPLDSNWEIFIERTNQILDYMRHHFQDLQFVYQPHPNETDEYTKLNLDGFVVGERTIAEIYLYDNADNIEYVFSACSWAAGSAFAMGINAAIFLETLVGAVSTEAIISYRSYFTGLPIHFFINSFDQVPVYRGRVDQMAEKQGLVAMLNSFDQVPKVWVLATDPALALRAALLLRLAKAHRPKLKAGLLRINHIRWELVSLSQYRHLFDVFDETIIFPYKKVWYSGHWSKIKLAVSVARYMKTLPLKPGEALISMSNLLFEENCLLSYFKDITKILLIESRWYNFVYEGGYRTLLAADFHGSFGIWLFNFAVEPLLGLHRTIFKEYKDGKLVNFFCYHRPLNEVYDRVFILMPDKL